MKHPVPAALLLAGLVLTACKKEEAPPPAPRSAPAAVSISGDGAAAPAGGGASDPAAPPPNAQILADTAAAKAPEVAKGAALIAIPSGAAADIQARLLTDALNVWEDWNGGKSPKTLSQLAEKRIIDTVPTPPQGMKFTIDPIRHQVRLEAEK